MRDEEKAIKAIEAFLSSLIPPPSSLFFMLLVRD
jgi:hypothetical protein